MSYNISTRTKLSVQRLEPRRLMAGDVSAFFAAGRFPFLDNLVVEGDQQANEIRVVEDGTGGATIEGLNGTTVNGLPVVTIQSESGYIVHSLVELGNGDDVLIYELSNNQSASHGTEIHTGNGDDEVTIGAAGALGTLRIETGVGDDRVVFELADSALLQALDIDTGNGDDEVLFQADAAGSSLIALRHIRIDTGRGNDTVRFQGSLAVTNDKSFAVWLGSGDDQLIGDPGNSLEVEELNVFGEKGVDKVFGDSHFLSDNISLVDFEEYH
ncbi:hypothetical protein CKO51_24845 [Rhodopirellula sp. SM50]|nr:hypothetical protein [Rhodopirellula sp. SM50]PAY16772.1 hypothetical protein CKO51_24845 [Rhodopirellula sp. SM50]